MSITIPEFVAKWQPSTRTERSASQEHFLDLCDALHVPKPADVDSTGKSYTFEKAVSKASGGRGLADVWYKGHFAWEYKGPHKDLNAAYTQLLQYTQALLNPPLLVVSDMKRFIVRTNFTNYPTEIYVFTLEDLITNQPTFNCPKPPIDVLRALFTNTSYLQPELTVEKMTEVAAVRIGELAQKLTKSATGRKPYDPHQVARYLMRVMFCLFAEDIELLPSHLFTTILEKQGKSMTNANYSIRQLFKEMARANSNFWGEDIRYFNGGLFTDEEFVVDLNIDELAMLSNAAALDWANVDPAIFGTLFERSIDPAKRSQLGAHYTSRKDIADIVEPVVMAPLLKQWGEVQVAAEQVIAQRDAANGAAVNKLTLKASQLVNGFINELSEVKILDPACGSGNFLYVALKLLLDLEKQVRIFAELHSLPLMLRGIGVSPLQLYGIEIDDYAHELASIVVWIGYIQWLHDNGFPIPTNPVLENVSGNIQERDAILIYNDNGEPIEPEWPEADYIIGNPPFLGNKMMRMELGDEYVEHLYIVYGQRIPNGADLVCYWFEKAREQILNHKAKRAALLATQGIRGGANRKVLENINRTGSIFWAQSDRHWEVKGVAVHVSMIGFDDGTEQSRVLDGHKVTVINTDLTSTNDLTKAKSLQENMGICFMGVTPVGPFDVDEEKAQNMLAVTDNPNRRPNSDVVKPWRNGKDITRRPSNRWIVDFGTDMSEQDAVEYKMPYVHILENVRAFRAKARSGDYTGVRWWLHQRPRPDMRRAIEHLSRYIVTVGVAKHRIFAWLDQPTLPDHALMVFARDDDYFFGVLHSKVHELWSRGMGTQLREVESGFRYTPTTTFETFPFPYLPGTERQDDPKVQAIASAARELVAFRDAWLNESGLSEAELKERTLTNLYNRPDERPKETPELRETRRQLKELHRKLDKAVLATYGWPADISDEEILSRLLTLNLQGRQ